jgi:hypothetical protein
MELESHEWSQIKEIIKAAREHSERPVSLSHLTPEAKSSLLRLRKALADWDGLGISITERKDD